MHRHSFTLGAVGYNIIAPCCEPVPMTHLYPRHVVPRTQSPYFLWDSDSRFRKFRTLYSASTPARKKTWTPTLDSKPKI